MSTHNTDKQPKNEAEDPLLDDVIASLLDEVEQPSEEPTLAEAPPQITGEDVQLTARAAKQVREIHQREAMDESVYLRIAVEGGGCSGMSYKLGFDHKTEDDHIVHTQNLEVLVDNRHLMYLKGIVIDYPDGLDARGFTFDNPNASETCGCGTSFSA
jgi:iron-sulfur cluster assembly protein